MTRDANQFYHIERHDDGTCTVSFFDAAQKLTTEDGISDWDADTFDMPVVWFDGLEENIREHYMVWLAHARAYCAQRAAFERALAVHFVVRG
ncbi:hypothetical protein LJC74_03680 [Eubacteriales bacterium OttesenSCG-928-A19]|nr:hypothetical protein [Eubacteriales bacterium OttesenSCG-928-A19]